MAAGRMTANSDPTKGHCSDFWNKLSIDRALIEPNAGSYIYDDFTGFVAMVAAGNLFSAPWHGFFDAAAAAYALATGANGVLRLDPVATDNLRSVVTASGTGGMGTIAAGKEFAWEARVAVNNVALLHDAFVGVTAVGITASTALLFGATAGMTVVDYAGFRILEGDPDGWDAVHAKTGGAEVVVKEVAVNATNGAFVNLGMRKKLNAPLEYFVNGAKVGEALLTATNFPTAILTPTFGVVDRENVETDLDAEWVMAFSGRA